MPRLASRIALLIPPTWLGPRLVDLLPQCNSCSYTVKQHSYVIRSKVAHIASVHFEGTYGIFSVAIYLLARALGHSLLALYRV